MSTTSTGSFAENAVARELAVRGYSIADQNWKTKYAEIDIIAKKDNTLSFVEVKYRRTLAAGDGFDYITSQKLQHMRRAAEAYVSINNWTGEYELLAASVIGEFEQLQIDIRQV